MNVYLISKLSVVFCAASIGLGISAGVVEAAVTPVAQAPVTQTHLTQIQRTPGQDQVLDLQSSTIAQQPFYYDHLKYSLQLSVPILANEIFKASQNVSEVEQPLPIEIPAKPIIVTLPPSSPKPVPVQQAAQVESVQPVADQAVPAPPAPVQPSSFDPLFAKYASEYGVSPELLRSIAQCESGMNPGAANGPYGGMFQFSSGTWASNRTAMGASPDAALRFDGEEAIKTAAFKISRDGIGAWPACGRKATAQLG